MFFARHPEAHRAIELAADQFLHWQDTKVRRLRVQRGTVWVTLDGDADDHVLGHGQCLVLPRRRHALMQSLDGAARIHVDALGGEAA
jgi:hypothetical protein